MKKFFLFALFAALSCTANAQLILGGQLGFSTSQNKSHAGSVTLEGTTNSQVILLPRFAYAFGNTWAGLDVGFVGTYTSTPIVPTGREKSSTTTVQVAPFVRFIKKPADNVGLWAEAQIAAEFGSAETEGRQTAKIFELGAGIRPGVIFFMGEHLSFEASFGRLGFDSRRLTDPDDSDNYSTTNTFGFNLNRNFLFGVNWMFAD